LRKQAYDLPTRLPFGSSDVAEAQKILGQSGRSQAEILQMVESSARVAAMAETSMVEAAKFTTTLLAAYGITAEKAGETTALLAYYADKSVYELTDLQNILGDIGPTAHAFGQDLVQTLQVASAFGKVGVPGAESGTLIRQLLVKSADPEISAALSTALSAQYPNISGLYDANTGKVQNIFLAYSALAKMMNEYLDSLQGAEWAEAYGAIQEGITKTFGVREIRSFLSLASLTFEDFQKMGGEYNVAGSSPVSQAEISAQVIQEAQQYEQKFMSRLRNDYDWAKKQSAATGQLLGTVLGGPMLSISTPFIKATTEAKSFLAQLIGINDTTRAVIPGLIFLGGTVIGLAGMIGVAAGALMLVKVRLADIGSDLLREERIDEFMRLQRMGLVRKGMSPSGMGLAYLRSFAIGPARAIGAIAILGSLTYLAWKNNLAGMRDVTDSFFQRWKEKLSDTGSIGRSMLDKVRSVFDWNYLKISGQGPSAASRVMQGLVSSVQKGGSLEKVGYVLKAVFAVLHWGFDRFISLAKNAGRLFGAIFTATAWVLGAGNMEEGWKRLGKALGWIITLKLVETASRSIYDLGKSILWFIARVSLGQKTAAGYRGLSLLSMSRALFPQTGLWASRTAQLAARNALYAARGGAGISGVANIAGLTIGGRIAETVAGQKASKVAETLRNVASYGYAVRNVPVFRGRPSYAATAAGALTYPVSTPAPFWRMGSGTTTEAFLNRSGWNAQSARVASTGGMLGAGTGSLLMKAAPWILGGIGVAALIYLLVSALKSSGGSTGGGGNNVSVTVNTTSEQPEVIARKTANAVESVLNHRSSIEDERKERTNLMEDVNA